MARATRRRFLQTVGAVTGSLLLGSGGGSAASHESDDLFASEDAWPTSQGTAGRTRATKAAGPTGPYLETDWSHGTPDVSGDLTSESPVIADGVVYSAAVSSIEFSQGWITAYDMASGEILWRRKQASTESGETVPVGAPRSQPVVSDESVYFAGGGAVENNSETHTGLAGIYALDAASGEIQWHRSNLSSTTTVEATDGRVYFDRGALDADTGRSIWEVDESGTLVGVAGNTMYRRSWDQDSDTAFIVARDATTGEKRWQREPLNQIIGTAATADTLYVTSRTSGEEPSYSTYALSGTNGSVEWRSPVPIRGTSPTTTYTVGDISETKITVDRDPHVSVPAVDESRVYVLTHSYTEGWFPGPSMSQSDYYDSHSALYAFDRSTGEELWRFETPIQAEAAPTVTDETVYFAGNYKKSDAIYALDAKTGTKHWVAGIPNRSWLISSPSIANNNLFMFIQRPMLDGYIYKFEATECGESVPDNGARTVRNDSDGGADQTDLKTSPPSRSASTSAVEETDLLTQEAGRSSNAASWHTSDESLSSTQKHDWRSPLAFVGGLGLSAGALLTDRSPLNRDT
ncbi:outer membrane protein assembly factor BamB family protein [Halomicrococcus sp. SG-WS-1]|uniref:outer membrane protein assembly factor BamB family protein n=1 Tax=Halomicrococcus sp. SG-WS-1 TaxID=3439057 RepID=UPI003F7A1CA6